MFEKFVCSWAYNSIEKKPAWETNRHSKIEEVPCLLWNLSMRSLSWTWWVCSLIPKLSLLQDFCLKFCICFWYLAYVLHLAYHLPWFDHSSNTVKGKSVPLQAWGAQRDPGSWGSQITWQRPRMVVRLSALRTDCFLPPENTPGTHFC